MIRLRLCFWLPEESPVNEALQSEARSVMPNDLSSVAADIFVTELRLHDDLRGVDKRQLTRDVEGREPV